MKGYHIKESAKKIMEREEKERQLEFKKLYPKKKPYPNANVTEVRDNAKKSGYPGYKKYTKGNFTYLVGRGGVMAYYTPSMKKKLQIMFEWSPKARKWKLITYRKGDW